MRTAVRFVKEGGADVVKLEGAGPMVSRARAIVERRDPRDGPRRPDAAVGDDARRLQDAGQDGRGRASGSSTARRSSRTAGCCSIVLEAVPAPVAARDHRGAVDPDDRDRRRRGLRRPGARLPRPARALGGPPPPLRQAVREPLRRDPRRARPPTRGRCGAAPSPRSSTRTRCPRRSRPRSRRVVR